MKRYSSTLCFEILCLGSVFLGGALAAQVETLYSLPPQSLLAFDVPRARVYLAVPNRHDVISINLTNGTEEAVFPLAMQPTALAMTPGGRWLYVSETQADARGYTNAKVGRIAEFDLAQGELVREIEVGFSPRSLVVTDRRLLAVSHPALVGGELEVRLFDATTGRASEPLPYAYGGLALDPTQTSIFGYGIGTRITPMVRAYFDPDQATFTTLRTTSDHDFLSAPVPSPDGELLISEHRVYRGSQVPGEDMTLLRVLDVLGGGRNAAFDLPTRGTFIHAGREGLDFFRCDNLERFRTLFLGNCLEVAYAGDVIYVVSRRPGLSRSMLRVPNLAMGIETNQPPNIVFTWEPPDPSSLQTLTFSAHGSTDDLDPPEALLYGWDFNHDGIYDTPLSPNALATQRLRTAGTHVVTLEVRDRFAAITRLEVPVEVRLEGDPGQPGSTTTPWELAYPVDEAVFDPGRPFLYAIHRDGKKLTMLNLVSGLVEREWQFDTLPGALAIRPDGSRLYVSQSLADPWVVYGPGNAWVAEIDPDERILTHEFEVSRAIFAMIATDSGLVVCQEQPGLDGDIHSYRASSGAKLGATSLVVHARLGLHPVQQVIYAAGLDENPSTLHRIRLNPATGALGPALASSAQPGGRIFALPNGTDVVTGRGALLAGSPSADPDLTAVRMLGVQPVLAVVPIPQKNLIGLLTQGRIRYLDATSWEPMVDVRADEFHSGRPLGWPGLYRFHRERPHADPVPPNPRHHIIGGPSAGCAAHVAANQLADHLGRGPVRCRGGGRFGRSRDESGARGEPGGDPRVRERVRPDELDGAGLGRSPAPGGGV